MTFEETPEVELKRQFNSGIAKEIVAFANADGGTIFIGVEDDGNVIGVPDAHAVEESVNCLIHDAIAPDLTPFAQAHVESFEDADLVVVNISRGPERPYCLASKGLSPAGVYLRQGTCAQPLPFESIRRMIRDTSPSDFEAERCLEQGLSFVEAARVLERGGMPFSSEKLQGLGCRDAGGFFTNLALLLSDQCPTIIKLAKFTGRSSLDFQTRREFSGSILAQTDQALEMLDMLNNLRASFDGGAQRTESRDIPPEALREALFNAVAHRDYRLPACIQVSMFDDRCEIISPGCIPEGGSEQGALAGMSFLRNHRLAGIMYRLKWIEAYGTGLTRIFACYQGYPVRPQVIFGDTFVKVVLPSVQGFFAAAGRAEGTISQGCGVVERAFVTGLHLTEDQQELLGVVDARQPVTKQDAAGATGFSATKAARILKELAQMGLVRTQGNTKARVYWLAQDYISG